MPAGMTGSDDDDDDDDDKQTLILIESVKPLHGSNCTFSKRSSQLVSSHGFPFNVGGICTEFYQDSIFCYHSLTFAGHCE